MVCRCQHHNGAPYKNAVTQNFFLILKAGCIYSVRLKTYDGIRLLTDHYILFYNKERIQLKTKRTPFF